MESAVTQPHIHFQPASKEQVMSLLLHRTQLAATVLLLALTACGGGGSDPIEPVPSLQRNDPVRDWTFSLYSSSATTGITRSVVTAQDGSGTQVGGLMEKLAGFGPTGLTDDELFLITKVVPPDGLANGFVFSTAGGATYGAFRSSLPPDSSSLVTVAGCRANGPGRRSAG
jgi:hypothetical protein